MIWLMFFIGAISGIVFLIMLIVLAAYMDERDIQRWDKTRPF